MHRDILASGAAMLRFSKKRRLNFNRMHVLEKARQSPCRNSSEGANLDNRSRTGVGFGAEQVLQFCERMGIEEIPAKLGGYVKQEPGNRFKDGFWIVQGCTRDRLGTE